MFTVSASVLRATLSRGARTVAAGVATLRRGGDVGQIRLSSALPAGRYALRVWRGRRVVLSRTLVVH
jgi:hypothetical protein